MGDPSSSLSPPDQATAAADARPHDTSILASGQKSHELFTCTVRSPPFAYAHLEAVTDDGGAAAPPVELDELVVRAYCTSALRQFLGDTGAAVAVDILKVAGRECWLRVPRDDLGAFAAAVTAWPGSARPDGGRGRFVLQLRACGDWLGSLLGRADQAKLWAS